MQQLRKEWAILESVIGKSCSAGHANRGYMLMCHLVDLVYTWNDHQGQGLGFLVQSICRFDPFCVEIFDDCKFPVAVQPAQELWSIETV